MDLLKQIVARAQSDKQRIVLPEAEEERTLKAADRALQDGLADIILIGNPENIRKEAEGLNVSESQIMALARFYTAALAGLTLEWIGSGMKGEPDSFIDDLGGMLDGNIRRSLERGCAHAAQ